MLTGSQINEVFALIRRAGGIVTEASAGLKHIKDKAGTANYVTEYDVSVQAYLIDGLKKIVPSARFLAEENDVCTDDFDKGSVFVIDPIDGTANFISDFGHSAISIGYCENGRPVFGAVYNPYRDELFSAVKGCGAMLNGNEIHVSSRDTEHALILFGSVPYYKEKYCHSLFSYLADIYPRVSDVRRMGSAALDLCYVACGRGDAFFEYRLSPWDYCAGGLIAEEAGAVISDMDGNDLHQPDATSVICAAAHETYDLLMGLYEKYR